MSGMRIDPKQYIEVYMQAYTEGETYAWVAKQLNMDLRYVYGFRKTLSRNNVILPPIGQRGSRTKIGDIANELNGIINSYTNDQNNNESKD